MAAKKSLRHAALTMAAKMSLRHAALSGNESPLMDHTLAIDSIPARFGFRELFDVLNGEPRSCVFVSVCIIFCFNKTKGHTLFFFTIRE